MGTPQRRNRHGHSVQVAVRRVRNHRLRSEPVHEVCRRFNGNQREESSRRARASRPNQPSNSTRRHQGNRPVTSTAVHASKITAEHSTWTSNSSRSHPAFGCGESHLPTQSTLTPLWFRPWRDPSMQPNPQTQATKNSCSLFLRKTCVSCTRRQLLLRR